MNLNVVVVGTGAFAHTHAKAIARQPRLRLAGFVGSRPGSADEIAGEYRTKSYPDLAAALLDEGIHGVIVATPHASHVQIGVAGIAAGKSVLVEKPLATTVVGCDQLVAAAIAGPGRGMVGHLMRWSPAHQQARALIASGTIGIPVSAEGRRYIDWQSAERRIWQKSADAGGGMWQIQGVHIVDQLSWLLDARAQSAVGLTQTRFHKDQDADDFGSALLNFGEISGRINIAGTRGRMQPQVYAEVLGTEGMLRVSHRGLLDVDVGAGWTNALEPTDVDHWTAMLDAELGAFAELIETGRVDTPFEYGRYVASVVEAISRSQQSGAWETVR